MERKAVTILLTIHTLCLCGLIAPTLSQDCDGEASVFEETEFCNSETFRPECAEDEVVFITSAQYGQMAMGRCVRQDFGHLGCANDVMPQMDNLCGGRQTCEVFVNETTFPWARPCPEPRRSYLRVAYKCVKVFEETEFCNSETFRPECAEDEVVFITSAQYGQMAMGRCVRQDFGHHGCANDVMPQMDNLCGGRQTCEVFVNETTFPWARPCPEPRRSYLRVAYKCVKVIIPQSRCDYRGRVLVTEAEGYLSSRITENTGCGSIEHPWMIQAPPGERINITLIDFSFNPWQSLLDNSQVCRLYAVIRETSAVRSTTVCGSRGREVNVYVSMTNVVEVRVRVRSASPQNPQFLLHYKAIR